MILRRLLSAVVIALRHNVPNAMLFVLSFGVFAYRREKDAKQCNYYNPLHICLTLS